MQSFQLKVIPFSGVIETEQEKEVEVVVVLQHTFEMILHLFLRHYLNFQTESIKH